MTASPKDEEEPRGRVKHKISKVPSVAVEKEELRKRQRDEEGAGSEAEQVKSQHRRQTNTSPISSEGEDDFILMSTSEEDLIYEEPNEKEKEAKKW